MPQVKTSKPLTYYIDNSFVRGFQEDAGESLDYFDAYEVWDLITILCQSAAIANQDDSDTLNIQGAIEILSEVTLSHNCAHCIKALEGFPAKHVNALMLGLLSVAFDGDE